MFLKETQRPPGFFIHQTNQDPSTTGTGILYRGVKGNRCCDLRGPPLCFHANPTAHYVIGPHDISGLQAGDPLELRGIAKRAKEYRRSVSLAEKGCFADPTS